jgi:hypothetical protein
MSTDPLTIEINGAPITASMEEWGRVSSAISDRRMADREAYKQAQRDAGEVWAAEICQCGTFGTGSDSVDEYFSLADAASSLTWQYENGDGSILWIKDPAGAEVTLDELQVRSVAASLPDPGEIA